MDNAERIIKRRINAATELLIDAFDMPEETAERWVIDAREWFKNNHDEDISTIDGLTLAMRAGYLYGMSKRLEN